VTDQPWTWVFARGEDRITIQRLEMGTSHRLTIEDPEKGSRSHDFGDLALLIKFQSDMEAFLVRTGWSLAEFHPERRTGRERRMWPRLLQDRRRWWTDASWLGLTNRRKKNV
jgi:hypothetical protein